MVAIKHNSRSMAAFITDCYPEYVLDHFRNLINTSMTRSLSILHISSKFTHNVLS